MKVSIIIPTFNEEKVIFPCIDSLSRQSLKDMEIIIVDDGSTDKTLKILDEGNFQTLKLQVLKQNHKGAGAARNLGAKHAKGEILVFVDADMTFDKDFLKFLIDPILKRQAKGTFSKEEYVSNWSNAWARCWNINEGWEARMRHPKNFPDKQKVFRAITKTEFEKVKGFTPGGYTDDWSLSEKLGYEAVVAPNAVFFHRNPDSLLEIHMHARWVGKRQYKFGKIGQFIGLLRASLPISILIGLKKTIVWKEPSFMIFKVVYDLGIFVGLLNFMMMNNGSK